MSSRHSIQVGIDIDPAAVRSAPQERSSRATRILYLGDFSGRGDRARTDLRAIAVDRDTLDEVMASLQPRVVLPDGELYHPREIDDLHPDALLERIGSLVAAREGRATTDDAAGLLDRIVDRVAGPERLPEERDPGLRPLDSVRAFAAAAASRDVVPGTDADTRAREEQAEAAAARGLRAILASDAMRSCERLWRGLDFIVRRVDTGPRARIYLADLPRAVVDAEIAAGQGIGESSLHALLAAGAGPEREPWRWVVMDGVFGTGPDDLTSLAWMTALCGAHGATLLADGAPALAGIPGQGHFTAPESWSGLDAGWSALRSQPEARHLALALPGFLLRVPYGADTAPIDAIDFEEVTGRPREGDYLWGGGALACVTVLAREAAREGDDAPAGVGATTLAGLPLHSWRAGTEAGTTCGAAAMTDAAAQRLIEAGLVPVAWARGADSVRVLLPRTAAGTSLMGATPR